ncbi:hypothetical protein ACQP0C_00795 [Nocardia sp. CA-129566]|uniref:hypothetical protein n=1 Tax=Nocardia sp. CA-129566 TaxID=3239976 RepID=UPI003D98726A
MSSSVGPTSRQFAAFETNLQYARDLVAAGVNLAGLRVGAFDVGDLYRSAWTQTVSALDHWLHLEIYAAVYVLADRTGAKPPVLSKVELPLSVIDKIQLGGLHYRDALLDRVQQLLKYQSLQNPKRIAETLKYVYAGGDLWGNVAKEFRAQGHNGGPWHSQSVAETLGKIIDRRNHISHSADLDNGVRRPIDHASTLNAIESVNWIARAIASIIESEIKQS